MFYITLLRIRSLPNTNITDLNLIPELQHGVSVKHHTRIPLFNKLILRIWGQLPLQLFKIISNAVRENKSFTIFAPSFFKI